MFNVSVAVPQRAISADGTYQFDLPTNPLSVILIGIKPLNDTGTLANMVSYLTLCQALNRVSVTYRGEHIVSMRGEDAAALAYFRHGIQSMQATHSNVNDARRSLVLPILLGRMPYDPTSCFPRSKRGDLILELDVDIADTGYNGMELDVTTIELLDAKPTEFEKKVQITQTFSATGEADVQMPIAGDCRGLLLWGTTAYTGASPAPTLGRVRTTVDNRELGYSAIDIETACMLHNLLGRGLPDFDEHKHIVTTDGNAQTELATLAGPYNVGSGWMNYAFLDFDPMLDDKHVIKPAGKDFRIRCTAEAAEAIRVIPIEVMSSSIISA